MTVHTQTDRRFRRARRPARRTRGAARWWLRMTRRVCLTGAIVIGAYQAATLLLTSLGPVVLHGGTEFAKSKGLAPLAEEWGGELRLDAMPLAPIYLKGRGDTYNLRAANAYDFYNLRFVFAGADAGNGAQVFVDLGWAILISFALGGGVPRTAALLQAITGELGGEAESDDDEPAAATLHDALTSLQQQLVHGVGSMPLI